MARLAILHDVPSLNVNRGPGVGGLAVRYERMYITGQSRACVSKGNPISNCVKQP